MTGQLDPVDDELHVTSEDTPHVDYSALPREVRIQRTEQLKLAGQSDYERWSVVDNFKSNWSQRASVVAQMIDPQATVLDLGCGRMDLERALHPDCKYIPADIVKRDERTLLCDLNLGVLPDVQANVVTLLGVIEYIHNPEALLRAVAANWSSVLITYNPTDLDEGRDRRIHGWFCDLTSAQMVEAATAAGFALVAQVPIDNRQVVYDFRIFQA